MRLRFRYSYSHLWACKELPLATQLPVSLHGCLYGAYAGLGQNRGNKGLVTKHASSLYVILLPRFAFGLRIREFPPKTKHKHNSASTVQPLLLTLGFGLLGVLVLNRVSAWGTPRTRADESECSSRDSWTSVTLWLTSTQGISRLGIQTLARVHSPRVLVLLYFVAKSWACGLLP